MNQKIVKSKIAPRDINVLWLDSNSNTLKVYDNGWQPLQDDYIKNIIQKNTGVDNTIIDFVDDDLKSIIENNEYVTARALNDLNKRIEESVEYIGTPIYIRVLPEEEAVKHWKCTLANTQYLDHTPEISLETQTEDSPIIWQVYQLENNDNLSCIFPLTIQEYPDLTSDYAPHGNMGSLQQGQSSLLTCLDNNTDLYIYPLGTLYNISCCGLYNKITKQLALIYPKIIYQSSLASFPYFLQIGLLFAVTEYFMGPEFSYKNGGVFVPYSSAENKIRSSKGIYKSLSDIHKISQILGLSDVALTGNYNSLDYTPSFSRTFKIIQNGVTKSFTGPLSGTYNMDENALIKKDGTEIIIDGQVTQKLDSMYAKTADIPTSINTLDGTADLLARIEALEAQLNS